MKVGIISINAYTTVLNFASPLHSYAFQCFLDAHGIENVIVEYRDRPAESVSKLSTFSDGWKVINTLFNLYRNFRPLAFFSFLAAIIAVISIGIFIPSVLIPYQETGMVEKFPTLIVCGFMLLAALLAVFAGLILDMIRMKARREHEFRLMLIESLRRKSCDINDNRVVASGKENITK